MDPSLRPVDSAHASTANLPGISEQFVHILVISTFRFFTIMSDKYLLVARKRNLSSVYHVEVLNVLKANCVKQKTDS